PYDTEALDPAVVEGARHSHPLVAEGGASVESAAYSEGDFTAPFAELLAAPPREPRELLFGARDLARVRDFVRGLAEDAALPQERRDDLVLAIHELATNSVRHGGGYGVLLAWRENGTLVCEVSDGGRIEELLVGRSRPARGQIGGYGVWLANQLCELVQVRTFDSGNVVRVHLHAS